MDDATKALEATNGRAIEKKGQILRVAYAKSIHGPVSGAPPSSSLAAAAIEAATFSQQVFHANPYPMIFRIFNIMNIRLSLNISPLE